MNLPSFMMISFMMTTFLVLTVSMCSHTQTLIMEKKTQFECGFNEISKNKSSFSTKFFLVMILFLIFDLEIAILLPSCTIQEYSKMSIMPPLIFVTMLTMAMMVEWFNGIIEWSS